jgi:hypothetical protein
MIIAAVLAIAPGTRDAAAAGLASLETGQLRLVYFDPTLAYLAPYAARTFTNSLAAQRAHFGFDPDGKVTVLLKDFSDYGNAAAGAVPRNTLLVDAAPISFVYETFAPSERMYTLMNHELVHVAMMDQAGDGARTARRWFGGKVSPTPKHPESIIYAYLAAPRMATPRWYLEGSAVFMETWMAGGLGRAQGAYDEMVFRSMVADDAYFYEPLGLVTEGTAIDFQVGVNAYLYGTRFMSWLALEYGPDKLLAWWTIGDDSGAEAYYARQFERVYGRPIADAWRDWIAFEHRFQAANLATVRQHPTTPHRDLIDEGLGSVSRAAYDPASRTLYAGVRYPGVVSHLAAISLADGSLRRLSDIKDPLLYQVTSLALDAKSQTLFYTTDNQAYRDLLAFDLRSGESRVLIKDARIGELVFDSTSGALWGVRHLNGLATLVRVEPPFEAWSQVHTFPYGETLYDLDVSPDGSRLSASVGEVSGEQTLRVYEVAELRAGRVQPVARKSFGSAAPEGFVFEPDGRMLVGSSYYTGVSNIFRYDPASDSLTALSNAETGFFRPVPLEDGRLLVMRYSGAGFVPAVIEPRALDSLGTITFLGSEIAQRHPEVREWRVPSPADVPLDSLVTRQGPYGGLRELSLESAYPIIQGYKNSQALGLHARFSDPIATHAIEADLSYSPDSALASDERLHAHLRYEHLGFSADARWNYADFYDLFGPSKVSLKGHSLTLGYERPLIYDKPRHLDLDLSASYYGGLERVPYFQDVTATYDELSTASVGLEYANVYKSLGAVDGEKGWTSAARVGGNYVDGELVPYAFAQLDLGLPLPVRHASVWLRTAVGAADGDADNAFANFFFGGFQNNWVDHQEVQRYRDPFTLPGFEINEVGGQRFGKAILELNLPPLRFRNAGSPGFYAAWMRPALFTSVLRTDSGRRDAPGPGLTDGDTYTNAGLQLDFSLFVLSRLDMTLSLGYARGFGSGELGEDEFMLSLKIL